MAHSYQQAQMVKERPEQEQTMQAQLSRPAQQERLARVLLAVVVQDLQHIHIQQQVHCDHRRPDQNRIPEKGNYQHLFARKQLVPKHHSDPPEALPMGQCSEARTTTAQRQALALQVLALRVLLQQDRSIDHKIQFLAHAIDSWILEELQMEFPLPHVLPALQIEQ
jgi:hypothetical protein